MPLLLPLLLLAGAGYVGGMARSSVDVRRGGRAAERIAAGADAGRRPPGSMLHAPGVGGGWGAMAHGRMSARATYASRVDGAGPWPVEKGW